MADVECDVFVKDFAYESQWCTMSKKKDERLESCMNKKCFASFVAGMAVMAVASTGIAFALESFTQPSGRLGERYEMIEAKLDLIDNTLSQYYLYQDDVDLDDLEEGIYAGYVDALDEKYTTYYTEEEYADLMESTSGHYSGIGAYVSQDVNTGFITIVQPFEGAPAANAGIQKEDIIFAVEGEEVTGEDLSMVVAKMKGEAGTTVNLTIYRPSEDAYLEFEVERAEVDVPSIEYRMLDHNIGYIQIISFEGPTAEQFNEAVENLRTQGMTSLIFDLRDNGGGLLTSVCDILETILPEGLMTYTVDRDGNKEEEWAVDSDQIDLPMVVLVNGNSASASELFTGALKDHDKATIIGTTTFGKGIVQSIIGLSDGSALKITTSEYYTPSGVCIHGTGIEPDVEIEYDAEAGEDNQLQAAVEYLTK